MADINSSGKTSPHAAGGEPAPAAGGAPRDAEAAWAIIELLFFAYRDFVGDPDAVLLKYAFGRAHHRVLHFVNRNPGMKVADLLDILNITKQSLGRVLKQLVDQGHALVQSNLRQLSATVAQGLPKDSKEALALLQQAANHGEAYAQSALGELYANGYGVPKDMNEAARWYQLAADQGVAEAKAFILEHARK